jgi:hypothetical protein
MQGPTRARRGRSPRAVGAPNGALHPRASDQRRLCFELASRSPDQFPPSIIYASGHEHQQDSGLARIKKPLDRNPLEKLRFVALEQPTGGLFEHPNSGQAHPNASPVCPKNERAARTGPQSIKAAHIAATPERLGPLAMPVSRSCAASATTTSASRAPAAAWARSGQGVRQCPATHHAASASRRVGRGAR